MYNYKAKCNILTIYYTRIYNALTGGKYMYGCVRLPEELINEIKESAKKNHRSIAKQVEHLTRLGKLKEDSEARLSRIADICKHNPDFSYGFATDLLDAIEESSNLDGCISIEDLIKDLKMEKELGLENQTNL